MLALGWRVGQLAQCNAPRVSLPGARRPSPAPRALFSLPRMDALPAHHCTLPASGTLNTCCLFCTQRACHLPPTTSRVAEQHLRRCLDSSLVLIVPGTLPDGVPPSGRMRAFAVVTPIPSPLPLARYLPFSPVADTSWRPAHGSHRPFGGFCAHVKSHSKPTRGRAQMLWRGWGGVHRRRYMGHLPL